MNLSPCNRGTVDTQTTNRHGTLGPRVAAFSWLAAIACAEAQTLHVIPALPGSESVIPYGVSADGSRVVGTSFLPGGDADRGFVWTLAGGSQAVVGAPVSFANAISGDGSTVVGFGFDNDFNVSGYSYRNGTMTLTGSLDGTGFNANANAVSFDGSVVVGQSDSTDGPGQRAFRWTSAGGIQSLGTLAGGTYSIALGVSGDGTVIVGNSGSQGDGRAFRWTQADGMKALPSLPGSTFDGVYGISSDGSIIAGSSKGQAVRWQNGLVEPLGLSAGLQYSSASSINANGQVIGGVAIDNDPKAFIWTPTTGAIDLQARLVSQGMNLSAWQLQDVSGISADGTVLTGSGLLNGQPAGWVISGFSAIPEPTPVALGLSALGFFGAMSWMRARRQQASSCCVTAVECQRRIV